MPKRLRISKFDKIYQILKYDTQLLKFDNFIDNFKTHCNSTANVIKKKKLASIF